MWEIFSSLLRRPSCRKIQIWGNSFVLTVLLAKYTIFQLFFHLFLLLLFSLGPPRGDGVCVPCLFTCAIPCLCCPSLSSSERLQLQGSPAAHSYPLDHSYSHLCRLPRLHQSIAPRCQELSSRWPHTWTAATKNTRKNITFTMETHASERSQEDISAVRWSYFLWQSL